MTRTVVAALLGLLSVTSAYAGDNPRFRAMFVDNTGTLEEMDNFHNPEMLAAMMQHATKLAPGSIVVSQDGQLFVLQDFRMANGQLATDELKRQSR